MLAAFVAIGLAAEPLHPALAAVEAGDRAFYGGERGQGVHRWREAIDRADETPEGAAAEAMARLRLLHAGSTWAALVHGGPIARRLEACQGEEVELGGYRWKGRWCALAYIDYLLWAPPPIQDPALAAELALQLGAWPPALSRRALATHDPTPVLALPESERDGLGAALATGEVYDPGSWVLGVGALAGAPTGPGVGVHLWHPDLFRRRVRLSLDGYVAVHAGGVSLSTDTALPVGPMLDASFQRYPWFDAENGASVPVDTARVAPGVRWRTRPGTQVTIAPLVRWDFAPGQGPVAGHGLWLAAVTSPKGRFHPRISGSLEWAIPPVADYVRVGEVAEVRAWIAAGRGVVAGRVRGEAAWGEYPKVREPTVGGPYVLRGARFGEHGGPWTTAADLEVRHPLVGPLWLAAFVDGAYVAEDGPHGGGGGGVRFVLPPVPQNTIRLDIAATDVGRGIYAAWGEAF